MLNAQTLARRKTNKNVCQDHDNGHTLETLCVSQMFFIIFLMNAQNIAIRTTLEFDLRLIKYDTITSHI